MTTVTSATTTTATTSNEASRTRIAQNFDQFLSLLTTQLKNQSPLDPLDANKFTEQLVQFAGVEQQLKMNDYLDTLIKANKTTAGASALSYIGTTVTADGRASQLQDGKATWNYEIPADAKNLTFIVRDKNNNEMYSEKQTNKAKGSHTFEWNGRTSTGSIAPTGEYTLEVQAKDATGRTLTVNTEQKGTVDSVDVTGDVPVLIVGKMRLTIDKVKNLQKSTLN